jgi:hypothetical protein
MLFGVSEHDANAHPCEHHTRASSQRHPVARIHDDELSRRCSLWRGPL